MIKSCPPCNTPSAQVHSLQEFLRALPHLSITETTACPMIKKNTPDIILKT